jgi:hypothetical protein
MSSNPISENTKTSETAEDKALKDAEDNFEEVSRIAAEETEPADASDEAPVEPKEEEEPVVTFEERWTQLLDNCKQKLGNLSDDDKDGQVRDLWTSINKYVTIMAVPKEILPKARKVLFKMAFKSSFMQALTLIFYALLTFLPRKSYRSFEAQQYFKKRLTRNSDKR